MSISKEARKFYESIRADDPRIARIEGLAMNKIRQWTGYESVNVGSFGLLLNLPQSDLDLSLGVFEEDIHDVCKILDSHNCIFKGQRETRPGTVRYVYLFKIESIEIDVAVMRFDDMQMLIPGLVKCRRDMSNDERIEHVFQKYILKQQNRHEDYAKFKLAPYIKYCLGFSWLPILS